MPRFALTATTFVFLATAAAAGDFRAVTAATLQEWLRTARPVALVDIQPREEFREHHFDGALSAAKDPKALGRIARRIARSKTDVVIVSPNGGEDALQAARLLTAQGVAHERIAVLENGMEGAAARAGCACCSARGADTAENRR